MKPYAMCSISYAPKAVDHTTVPQFPPPHYSTSTRVACNTEEFSMQRGQLLGKPLERTHVGDGKRPSAQVARRFLRAGVCRRNSIALVTCPLHVAAPATRTATTIALSPAVVADSATLAAAALATAAVAHRTAGVANPAANPATRAAAATADADAAASG